MEPNLNAPREAAAVAIQKIPFWSNSPAAWFRVIENQFVSARINSESSRFNHVIGMLDADAISKCMDVIEGLSPEHPYTEFRAGVLARFAESEQSRLQRVLMGTDLGDRKPSQLLSEMRALAGNAIGDEALKTLWLQRLPSQVRAILAASTEPIAGLALLGDRVMETISISSHTPSISVVESGLERQISSLVKRLDGLEKSFRDFRNRSRGRSGHRSRVQSNLGSGSVSPQPGSSGSDKICFYHRRYKERARYCNRPCSYSSRKNCSADFSENS